MTWSGDFPAADGGAQSVHGGGNQDAVVARFDKTLSGTGSGSGSAAGGGGGNGLVLGTLLGLIALIALRRTVARS